MALDQQSGNQNDKSPPLPPPSTLRASWRLTIFVFSLFLACIALPWWWFHSGSASSEERLRIEVSRQVPGYLFTNTPVSERALQILSTTNLFDGLFIPATVSSRELNSVNGNRISKERIRVFTAEWQAKSGQDLAVVQHTPDICWVGAGWTLAPLGQPTQILLELPSMGGGSNATSTVLLPFECRVFQSPNGGPLELVLWCTLVGGHVLPEVHLFQVAEKSAQAKENALQRMGPFARRLAISHFWQLVQSRTPAQSSKQFVRFSIPIVNSWELSIDDARSFAKKWIVVKKQDSKH